MSASTPQPPGLVPPVPHSPDEPPARRTPAEVAKDIALFFASPFVTMACLAMFPFIAIAELRRARRQRDGTG